MNPSSVFPGVSIGGVMYIDLYQFNRFNPLRLYLVKDGMPAIGANLQVTIDVLVLRY